MKTLTALTKTLLLVMMVSLSLSCNNDDDNTVIVDPGPTNSIVELAQATPQLSSLVSALVKYPDLVTLLSESGTYTVFAPDNDAFAALLTAIGQTSIDDIPEDVLKNVLQYHVFTAAAVEASAVTTGPITMANGEEANLVADSNGVSISGATVTTADVEGTNGIVHIIDSVIVPPSILPIVGTIVAPAYFNKDFTTLIAAVQAANTDILGLLLGNGPSDEGLTLFAPTNAAFEAAGITDVNGADAVLAYHVVDGTVMASMLPSTTGAAAGVPTLGGENIYITNAGGDVSINGTTTVVATDIVGSNGVVHVIDRTLLPPTQTINEIVGDFAGGDPAEFTLLAAALARAGLADFFAGDGPYTVFAPVDAAFEAAGLDLATINGAEPSVVAGILTHHVVQANVNVFSTDLVDGNVTMLNEQDVTISLGDLTVQDASGSDPAAGLVPSLLNVLATNGVVHVIDKVLLPSE
ncbi:fasciclin domain-containing protein [Flaviramulus sp. BrNp1-15]|uniref:fasciclin domain-containing protein n=1 Tax=Flaviramulus sp. BrNp1-15 TaxID=2916754 RepID=UPI001EE7D803|nr:fasciclin domain-containing protein [Flaviramulus sp. BrNp1-15]ULC58553.1 fasciclin domain-containing protein [Flaviramulus sp. BrNp1-15]